MWQQLALGLIFSAVQLVPVQVMSERPESAPTIGAQWHASELSKPTSFAETGPMEQEQADLSQNLIALAKRIRSGDPVELTYPDYNRYSSLVAEHIAMVHNKVTKHLDDLAHQADTKSAKYGYGLDGMRVALRNLQTSVQTYKQRVHTNFHDQAASMAEGLEDGKLWKHGATSKHMPEGWGQSLKEGAATEISDQRHGRTIREHLGPAVAHVGTNPYLHPDTSAIYKAGYSHGFKDAIVQKPHGLKGPDLKDMPAGWEHHLEEHRHHSLGKVREKNAMDGKRFRPPMPEGQRKVDTAMSSDEQTDFNASQSSSFSSEMHSLSDETTQA